MENQKFNGKQHERKPQKDEQAQKLVGGKHGSNGGAEIVALQIHIGRVRDLVVEIHTKSAEDHEERKGLVDLFHVVTEALDKHHVKDRVDREQMFHPVLVVAIIGGARSLDHRGKDQGRDPERQADNDVDIKEVFVFGQHHKDRKNAGPLADLQRQTPKHIGVAKIRAADVEQAPEIAHFGKEHHRAEEESEGLFML